MKITFINEGAFKPYKDLANAAPLSRKDKQAATSKMHQKILYEAWSKTSIEILCEFFKDLQFNKHYDIRGGNDPDTLSLLPLAFLNNCINDKSKLARSPKTVGSPREHFNVCIKDFVTYFYSDMKTLFDLKDTGTLYLPVVLQEEQWAKTRSCEQRNRSDKDKTSYYIHDPRFTALVDTDFDKTIAGLIKTYNECLEYVSEKDPTATAFAPLSQIKFILMPQIRPNLLADQDEMCQGEKGVHILEYCKKNLTPNEFDYDIFKFMYFDMPNTNKEHMEKIEIPAIHKFFSNFEKYFVDLSLPFLSMVKCSFDSLASKPLIDTISTLYEHNVSRIIVKTCYSKLPTFSSYYKFNSELSCIEQLISSHKKYSANAAKLKEMFPDISLPVDMSWSRTTHNIKTSMHFGCDITDPNSPFADKSLDILDTADKLNIDSSTIVSIVDTVLTTNKRRLYAFDPTNPDHVNNLQKEILMSDLMTMTTNTAAKESNYNKIPDVAKLIASELAESLVNNMTNFISSNRKNSIYQDHPCSKSPYIVTVSKPTSSTNSYSAPISTEGNLLIFIERVEFDPRTSKSTICVKYAADILHMPSYVDYIESISYNPQKPPRPLQNFTTYLIKEFTITI